MYRHLSETIPEIYTMAKKIPGEIGMPEEYLGKVGLSGTVSECHGLLRKEISDAVEAGNRKVINNSSLDFELRRLVKSVYGDDYDAVAASTCEALLGISFDTMVDAAASPGGATTTAAATSRRWSATPITRPATAAPSRRATRTSTPTAA